METNILCVTVQQNGRLEDLLISPPKWPIVTHGTGTCPGSLLQSFRCLVVLRRTNGSISCSCRTLCLLKANPRIHLKQWNIEAGHSFNKKENEIHESNETRSGRVLTFFLMPVAGSSLHSCVYRSIVLFKNKKSYLYRRGCPMIYQRMANWSRSLSLATVL